MVKRLVVKMAISLNNHETRIKALENSSSSSVSFEPKLLWSGRISGSSITNTEFSQYKLFILEMGVNNEINLGCCYPFISSVGTMKYTEIVQVGDNRVWTISLSGNTFTHTQTKGLSSLIKVYGVLK